jgi:PAS domain S-box-containing protein
MESSTKSDGRDWMTAYTSRRLISTFQSLSNYASLTVITVGLLVLFGWVFDIPSLTSLFLGLATMKANSALAFFLAGFSLWLASTKREIPAQRRDVIAKACAMFTVLIGLLTLGEYIFSQDFGIDQLLIKDRLTPENAFPGRMAPVTALNFSLLGFALLILNRYQHRWPTQVFSIIVLLISILALIGYAYGVPYLYDFFPYSSIAIHTAFAFSILSIGILLAWPEQGLIKIFSRDDPVGVMARRLIPAAVVLPLLLGWLLLTGERMGLYDSTLRPVLSALSTIIAFTILIAWNASLLQSANLVRQQAQAQLGQLKEREAAILDASLDAVITIDHEGRVLEFNPAAQKIFGYERAEVLGREMAQLIIPPSLREQHRRGLARYLATGEGPVLGKRLEMQGMRADGTEFPVELTITVIAGGDQPIFTGFVRDITQRIQAEKTLQESEERFRLVVRAAPSAMISVDREGKINLVNMKAEELFGYRKEELLGRPVEILIPERFREGHIKYRQNFLAQPASRSMGAGRDLFCVHKDGHEIPVEIGLTPYESSEGFFTLALIVDITERKEAEAALLRVHEELEAQVQERTAALSEANALLQMLLDHMPDHIYFKDAQSRFIRNSRSQAKALGLNNPSEVVGKSDFDFFPHAQLSYEKEQEIIRSGRPLVDMEEWVVWPDGRGTWVSTTKVPLLNQAGQIIGTFGISRDITDRKQSETAIQKAKLELEAANKELEAFSYSVSHDLRSPLRSIDGFSQALLEDYEGQLPEGGRNYLHRIRVSAQRMSELIDDLLSLSKVTRAPLQSRSVNISDLAQSIANDLKQTQPERDVTFRIAADLITRGDPQLLKIMLENLINNAWKFTSKRTDAYIEVGAQDDPGGRIFFVRDNGAGFDMAFVNKLFGAFQRLHSMNEFPGTGIGLATVQRIINRHGGSIWAEGAVDEGATFFFTLPAPEVSRPRPLAKEEDSIIQRAKEII